MKAFLVIFIFILVSNPSFGLAATSLSWKQAVELTRNNSPELKANFESYQSTRELENQAHSGYLPSLSASLGYTQSKSTPPEDVTTQYLGSVTLSQNIFAGFKDKYKVAQALASTRVAEVNLRSTKAKISYDLINAYQSLLTAQDSVALSESIVQRRKDDLHLVELRFEGGRENKGSVLLSEAYLAQAKYEKLIAEHNLEDAEVNLRHLLGIEANQKIVLTDSPPLIEASEQPNFEEAARRTPSYEEASANLDSNLAAIEIARSAFYPSLSLSATAGKSSADFFPKNDRWSMAATLSIPIYDGGKDLSSLRSNELSKNSSEYKTKFVEQSQIEALQQAYQKFVQSVEKQKVDASFEKAAKVRAEIARSQYNNGLISFTDWDNIESDLILRQKTFVQSKKDRVLSEANWKKTIGEGVL